MNEKTIPNVFVVGAPKAGTTTIHATFENHKDVFVPKETKELNFMAFEGARIPLNGPGDNDSWAGQSILSPNDYFACYGSWGAQPFAVDVSPVYLYAEGASTRIRAYRPDAKIIMILRNPVDAAYSMFQMLRRQKRETTSNFCDAFDLSEERTQRGWEWAWNYKELFLYAVQVERYLSQFPRQNIFVASYDKLRREPQSFWTEMARFLCLSAPLRPPSKRYNSAPTVAQAFYHSPVYNQLVKVGAHKLAPRFLRTRISAFAEQTPAQRINRRERAYILSYFQDDITKLGSLLDWDVSRWLTQR